MTNDTSREAQKNAKKKRVQGVAGAWHSLGRRKSKLAPLIRKRHYFSDPICLSRPLRLASHALPAAGSCGLRMNRCLRISENETATLELLLETLQPATTGCCRRVTLT